jgi:hypothetical protein
MAVAGQKRLTSQALPESYGRNRSEIVAMGSAIT